MANKWQNELEAECRKRGYTAPVYNIISDRRGGRTAWSATVTVNGQNIPARYWYDGQFLNNAKEDAAEVACIKLRNPTINNGSQNPATTTSNERPQIGFRREAGVSFEEEKVEPEEEKLPEGAIGRVGEEILD